MCPQERLVIISKQTGLSFALERIGPLAAIIIVALYLLALYLSVISKTHTNLSPSAYSEILIKTACQHLLLLVGFDTLIYRKYYDTPPILVGHQDYFLAPLPGSEALLVSGIGKENFSCKCCFYFCLLICLIMERGNVAFLFGKPSTTAEVQNEAPPADIVPFKIPMKIIERVMNNRYI